MAARYAAGAAGLPLGVLRAYAGTDLPARTKSISTITCPFTGEELAAVAALRPDVTVIHAQQADWQGNVAFWGITGVQKEAVLAARTSIVTVEEVVDQLRPHGPNHVVLPSFVVSAVAPVPQGCHPSYAMGYSSRENRFYLEWDRISADRELFEEWLRRFVLEPSDHAEYMELLSEATAQVGKGRD
jgi:glutaconate CoA-transferase subunit A